MLIAQVEIEASEDFRAWPFVEYIRKRSETGSVPIFALEDVDEPLHRVRRNRELIA